VVPEVAQAASWSLFGLALAVLAALLVLPALIRLGRGAARRVPLPRRAEPQPAVRVRLREAATPTERSRIRLHEAGTAAAGEDHAHHP
jgi:hypothetical protein